MPFFSSKKQVQATSAVISRPIHYYSNDSLNFNSNSSKSQLYGEIYSKASATSLSTNDPMNSESHGRSRYILTTILYVAIALLSLTSTALFAAVIPIWERNFEHTRSPIKGDWTDGLMILPLTISFISTAWMIALTVRSRQQQRQQQQQQQQHLKGQQRSRYQYSVYHDDPKSPSCYNQHDIAPLPFYTILISTTILLTLTPLLILASTNSLARAFRSSNLPPSPSTQPTLKICNLTNVLTKPCIPILYRIGELQIGAAATSGLVCSLWIIVLILSIRRHIHLKTEEERQRCERRKRRHARRQARRHARRERERDRNREREGGRTIPNHLNIDIEKGIVIDYDNYQRRSIGEREKELSEEYFKMLESQTHEVRATFPARQQVCTRASEGSVYSVDNGENVQVPPPLRVHHGYRTSEHIIGMKGKTHRLVSEPWLRNSSSSVLSTGHERHVTRPRESMRAWMNRL